MRDRTGAQGFAPSVHRRFLIAGAVLSIATRGVARAETRDMADPPILRTARSQYTILDPAMPLGPLHLNDIGGRDARLDRAGGKVHLVHIWASWCPACREDLIALERFGLADPEVTITTIATDRSEPGVIKRFLDLIGVRHLTVLLDPDGRVAGRETDGDSPLPVHGLPITYLVTPSSLVAGYIKGDVDWGGADAQRLLRYYADR